MAFTDFSDNNVLTAAQLDANFNMVREAFNYGQRNSTFGGTGADGAKTVSASENIAGDQIKNYTNLTINTGQTWTVNSGNWLIVKCTGNLTISGTGIIDISGRGGAGGTGESGGGNNATSGGDGWNGVTGGALNNADGGGNGGGGWVKGTIGSGSQTTGTVGKGIWGWNFADSLGYGTPHLVPFWGGGGGGAGINGANAGGSGGAGGGLIIFEVAGDVTIEGTIDASGDAGSSVTGNGGGGGGGGCIIILYKGTLTESTPAYTVSGGNGGTGSGGSNGGAGGAGNYFIARAWTGAFT